MIEKILKNKYLSLVGKCADKLEYETCVVGGFVRDLILNKQSNDLDFVCVGSGIKLAQEVQVALGNGAKLDIFESYGTAHIQYEGVELEFVGARKEFYHRESRNPIVEDGTLFDDISRRDFTINNIAIRLNDGVFGEYVDYFNGQEDLKNGIIRTPLDPNITFSDDPLRMLRCIRFATRFNFEIEEKTLQGIKDNVSRIEIIVPERIIDEINKILLCNKPSIGFKILEDCGLLKILLPELHELNIIEYKNGVKHKNIFEHTLEVLDNVSLLSNNLYLRWSALLHDLGKLYTKQFDEVNNKWTFHNHEHVGAEHVSSLFKRLHLPLDNRMDYVKKMVELHMRPIKLVDDGVTDAGVRRLLFSAGEYIDDLMILASSDITSKKQWKKDKYKTQYINLKQRMIEIEEKDHIKNFQPPVDGEEIMEIFSLKPCKLIGEIKENVKNAILDGIIPNDHDIALDYIKKNKELTHFRC